MLIAAYIAAIFIGLTLGLVGGGGSILALPILVYLAGFDPITATSYSLFTVGLTALVGSVQYMVQGQVSLRAAVVFALPSFAGVFITRSYVLPNMPEVLFHLGELVVYRDWAIMVFFALLMLGTSVSMIRGRNEATAGESALLFNLPAIAAAGVGVGIITGLVGAGGGFMIVPALVLLVRLPMRTAVGTTLLVIAANSGIGIAGDLVAGLQFDYSFLLLFSGLAVVGIFIGNALAKRIDGQHLKAGFGYFIVVAATFIIAQEIFF